nr:Asp23/Gls24 family envelope stress response protein [uncultured Mogibacterium sp.]
MSKSKDFKEKNTIEDSVIAGYAAQETMKLPGVIRMAPGIAESFSRNILGRITETQGVHVNDEDEKVTVDIHIIAAYGVNIPQLSYDIQNRVKKIIEKETGISVEAVNICIEGVEKSR